MCAYAIHCDACTYVCLYADNNIVLMQCKRRVVPNTTQYDFATAMQRHLHAFSPSAIYAETLTGVPVRLSHLNLPWATAPLWDTPFTRRVGVSYVTSTLYVQSELPLTPM